VPATHALAAAVRRVADHDERLAARLPHLAVAVHHAADTGRPFSGARDALHQALARNLRLHTELEARLAGHSHTVPHDVTVLVDAAAAQHRAVAGTLEELASARTGLDAVAATRALHALLSVHRDLERRLQDVLAR
jgi:hypothetical protein